MSLSRFSINLSIICKRGAVLSLLILINACNADSQAQSQDVNPQTQTQVNRPKQVVALGKLIPKGEVIKLSVANAEDSRVNQILVNEGDRVEKNQVIAILQGLENRQRDLEEATKQVELAQARLEQVRAGDTKKADLAAQKANISRLQSQLRNETVERQAAIASAKAQLRQAELTYERNQTLLQQGAVTQQASDQAKEALDIAQAALNERKAQQNNTRQTLQQEINQEQENLARLDLDTLHEPRLVSWRY
ncbi:MAG: hypothetical protein ACFCU7_08475 [Pleurocapsa sp.]